MAHIDHERKRISAIILLYGPPGAGKTTTLYALGRQLPAGTHGKVSPLNQGDGRLLRLDYRPNDQELVYGYQVNFRLVACPGAIEVDLLRPILPSVDAVLFVADSARTALQSNAKALELLDKLIRGGGKTLADTPMVFLYNKRDLREAVEIRQIEEKLNRFGCSYLAASAIRGQGVLDALQRLTATVAVHVRQQVQSEAGGTPGTGNVKTLAHGTTFQNARALHQGGGRGEGDDVTAVSAQGGRGAAHAGGGWGGDDDHTEVNPASDAWEEDAGTGGADSGASGYGAGAAAYGEEPHDEWADTGGDGGGGDHTAPSPAARPDPYRAVSEPGPLDPPKPLHASGSWRTPEGLEDDIDADDRTAPYRDRGSFSEPGADATDSAYGARAYAASPAPAAAPRRAAAAPPPARPIGRPAGGGGPATASMRAPPQAAPAAASAPPAQASAGAAARARRVDAPPRRAPVMPEAPPPATASMRIPSGAGHTGPLPVASGPGAAAGLAQRLPPFEAAPSVTSTAGAGELDFSATQVINALGRQPEAWERDIVRTAHPMKIPVADLAGYVVSRIGTPSASTRRTITVPVRATHMDTLMPQDFLLEIEFRGGGPMTPQAGVARPAEGVARTVPLGWFVALFGVALVVIAALVFGFLNRMA